MKKFDQHYAKQIGDKLMIDWHKISIEDYTDGINIELEHGKKDPKTNVTNDDPIITGKIALAHLNEFPDYYKRLKKMEQEAESFWQNKK